MKPFEEMDDYADLINGIDVWYAKEAKDLGKILIDYLHPRSVIDVGCASGIYLLPFKDAGAMVFGIEGDETGGTKLAAGEYKRFDLRFPFYPNQKYDLAMCIEVAEHLPEEYANILVESLVRCSDTIFFTAARPGQGGHHHHNEQEMEYWLEKFAKYNYYIQRNIQPLIQNLPATPWISRGVLIERQYEL